jgi:hypothetical protein
MKYAGLQKIISGGQTGADQGGLHAALETGVKTGGTAPKGFQTSAGPAYLLAAFGLKDSGTLQTRTKQNIKDSDGTVILTVSARSPGSVLTRRLCSELNKPYLDLDIAEVYAALGGTGWVPGLSIHELGRTLSEFIQTHQISTLNVAGNREKSPDGALHFATVAVVKHAIAILDLEGMIIRDTDL